MSYSNNDATTSTGNDNQSIQFAEDPHREPDEKETALSVAGTDKRVQVTSFKKSVFAKLIERPSFNVQWLNVRSESGNNRTVDSLDEVAAASEAVVGVTGTIPVGALTIGTPRSSDSHAQVVK